MSKSQKTPAKNENLFEIVNNVELKGSRASDPNAEVLARQMLKLKPKDKNQSVSVPIHLYKDKTVAANLILAAKRTAKEIKEDAVFSTRFHVDPTTKKYLGANIWRIN